MINREISEHIIQAHRVNPVVLVNGPRQSGKTTLIRHLFKDLPCFNLEEPETRAHAINDPKDFLRNADKGMIIDEVQRVPELLSYIQVISDESGKPGLFVLSGSQNLLLLEKVTQSLAGRVALFQLLPLSMSELASCNSLDDSFEDVCFRGFYPALYKRPDLVPSIFYSDYVQTYLERDVRLLKNIGDLELFRTFLVLCAGRTGQLINLNSLANDVGISANTVKSWLAILEACYVVHLLYPYYRNLGKRRIKTPKIYFHDTGLLCSLLGINDATQISSHYLKGGIFENMIIGEILKHISNTNQRRRIFFWRDKTGREVDFVMEKGAEIIAGEIKSAKTVNEIMFRDLNYFCGLSKTGTDKGILIYGGDKNQNRSHCEIFSWKNMNEVLLKI